MKPPYRFRYNEARDGLIVHEPEMLVLGKIFRLAAEGLGTRAIQGRLYREGIPSPTGRELWHRPVLKRMVLSDTYKPHTYKEALELVPKEVADALKKGREYGIRWWNRSSQKSRQDSETTSDGGRHYRRKVEYASRNKEEWVAVSVPAFLARELVEAARSQVAAPRAQERKNLARGWELRGLIRCPSCGSVMTTQTTKSGGKLYYYYYRCHLSVDYRRNRCKQRLARAEPAEEAMWEFVFEVMKDPERIRIGMDARIEQKRAAMRGDPERETKTWLERLSEVDH
jgi:site-specific DNA recombinase